MKFDSPLFDQLRVKPDKDRRRKTDGPVCEWAGCKEKATHRAPKGRGREKDYWRFCLNHVREYNQSYNFFTGMSDAAVLAYQKDALTGHRPTWKMGTGKGAARPDFKAFSGNGDPFGLFGEGLRAEQQAQAETRVRSQCRAQSARYARPRCRRNTPAGENAVQGTGQTPPSRRQWRRPLDRRPPGRDHSVVQLSEIGRLRLIGRWSRRNPAAPFGMAPSPILLKKLIVPFVRPGFSPPWPSAKLPPHQPDRTIWTASGLRGSEATEDQ